MKALVIDDSRLARTELKRLLKSFDNLEVVGEAADAIEAIEKITNLEPDVLFLDIQMPGKSGFELLEELKSFDGIFIICCCKNHLWGGFELFQ